MANFIELLVQLLSAGQLVPASLLSLGFLQTADSMGGGVGPKSQSQKRSCFENSQIVDLSGLQRRRRGQPGPKPDSTDQSPFLQKKPNTQHFWGPVAVAAALPRPSGVSWGGAPRREAGPSQFRCPHPPERRATGTGTRRRGRHKQRLDGTATFQLICTVKLICTVRYYVI